MVIVGRWVCDEVVVVVVLVVSVCDEEREGRLSVLGPGAAMHEKSLCARAPGRKGGKKKVYKPLHRSGAFLQPTLHFFVDNF